MKKQAQYLFALGFFLLAYAPLSAQEISHVPKRFSTTYYLDEQQISKAEVNRFMESDAQANLYWQKYRTQKSVATGFQIASFGFGIWLVVKSVPAALDPENNPIATPAIGALISIITAYSINHSARTNQTKALEIYNQNQGEKTTWQGTISAQGIGIRFRF